MSPTLSVVIPNFNHAEHIPRVIEELVNQTRPADEILLLDDASTDHSREVLHQVEREYATVRVLYNKQNLGVVASQRRLFEAATGDYLYAGAMDDKRLPSFFEQAMSLAEQYPEAGLICGKMVSVNEQDERLGVIDIPHWTSPHYAKSEEVISDYLDRVEPSHSLSGASIYRRDVLQSVGWFPESLSSWGDTFAGRSVALKSGIAYAPEEVVHWTHAVESFSGQARSDAATTLKLISQAAELMRTPEFAQLFPKEHVTRWQKRYRKRVLGEVLKGVYSRSLPESKNRLIRYAHRMKRLPELVRIWSESLR